MVKNRQIDLLLKGLICIVCLSVADMLIQIKSQVTVALTINYFVFKRADAGWKLILFKLNYWSQFQL